MISIGQAIGDWVKSEVGVVIGVGSIEVSVDDGDGKAF